MTCARAGLPLILTLVTALQHAGGRTSPGEASRLVNVWDRPPAYYGLKGRDTIQQYSTTPGSTQGDTRHGSLLRKQHRK